MCLRMLHGDLWRVIVMRDDLADERVSVGAITDCGVTRYADLIVEPHNR